MTRITRVVGLALFAVGVSVGCGKKPDPTPEAKPETQPAPQEQAKADPKPAPTPKPGPKPKPKPKPGPSAKEPEVIFGAYNEFNAKNQFRNILFAVLTYEETHKHYPAGVFGPGGTLGLSWRVALLPYINDESAKLYKEFKLAEAWDSPHNKALLTKMPKLFATPGTAAAQGKTYLRSFAGPKAFIPLAAGAPTGGQPGQLARGRTRASITDGENNTLMVVEATDPVEWTKPDDLPLTDDGPFPKLGLFQKGFLGMRCDGSIDSFPETVTEASRRALASANAGDRPGPEVHIFGLTPPKK